VKVIGLYQFVGKTWFDSH